MTSIRKLRNKTGLSQAAFARALKIPKSSMCSYESGRIKPSFDVAYRMLALLKKLGFETSLEEIRPK